MKKAIILCVLSGLLGGFVSLGLRTPALSDSQSAAQDASPWQPAVTAQPVAVQPVVAETGKALTPDERVNIFVYQQTNQSVVNINTEAVSGNLFLMETVSKGQGSGIVIDRAGHVLTNFHVVEGARQISVTLFDHKQYAAKLIGADPDTDIAVLKIDAPVDSLHPVAFGSSANLLVGQRVFAIGNPFGFERTLSTGIVSSLDRSLPSRRGGRSLKSIIQIDAAINPGNSGGPLLDSQARMIGMNTAIASRTGESVGVGFAIPVNTIGRVVPQLIQSGRVRRPESGIARVVQTERGLVIASLAPKGPAERAGLQGARIVKEQKRNGPFIYQSTSVDWSAADMIVAVDGRSIKTADDFLDAIEAKQPGDTVNISVVRAGQRRDIPLRLEASE
jgi:S1-C subfamily serine protease